MDAVTPVVEGLEIYELKIAETQPEFLTLPSLRSTDGRVLSRWRPNESERRALLAGADIFLTVCCGNHLFPPVSLAIMEPSADFVLHDMHLDDAMELRMMGGELQAISDEIKGLTAAFNNKAALFHARKDAIENRIAAEAGGKAGAE